MEKNLENNDILFVCCFLFLAHYGYGGEEKKKNQGKGKIIRKAVKKMKKNLVTIIFFLSIECNNNNCGISF